MGGQDHGQTGGGVCVVLMEGKKEERCISGPQIAAVYSSTNPKFCAAPAVARKQLTVKRGDQRD